MGDRNCKIISFVSSQGGIGRSMAVANVGWALASSGARVLAVDFNLAAPSLHRYFRPFLDDPQLASTSGVMDAAIEFSVRCVDASPASRVPLFTGDSSAYGVSLDWAFLGDGCLDLLPAGRQDVSYAENVLGFAWRPFLRSAGSQFISELVAWMRRDYDYVLIDAPSGFSETTPLCTEQLPDAIALCFGLSAGSLEGARRLAERVSSGRVSNPVAIFPVPMRLDFAETELSYRRLAGAQQAFGSLIPKSADLDYWAEVAVPYSPFYAYDELLAAFSDLTGANSVVAAAGRLAAHLAGDLALATRLFAENRYPNAAQRAEVAQKYALVDGFL